MQKVIYIEFDIGETVFLITDEDQKPRLVTEIKICADGGMLYYASIGEFTYTHYGVELSRVKNLIIGAS